jgi:hypothetical protein
LSFGASFIGCASPFWGEYGKKIDNDFRFRESGGIPPPLIYAFHRFSVHVRSQIFEFAALARKILSAWNLRLSKSWSYLNNQDGGIEK